MAEIASLVLFSSHPERAREFYQILGLDLQDEDHGDEGAVHFATEVSGVHFAIYAATASADRTPGFRAAGSAFPGFYVTSLEDALSALSEQGAAVLAAHEVRDWGCRAIVEDPDGRAVEINQRNHCPES